MDVANDRGARDQGASKVQSVYVELLRVGVGEEVAGKLSQAVTKSEGVVTVEVLDLRVAELKTLIAEKNNQQTRLILATMISMTAIFGGLVAFLRVFGGAL